MDKVTVIIPTYNRFKYLLNTIKSIKSQTYPNLEIIVINDKSTQKEYYEYNVNNDDVKILHLEINSKEIFGFACAGFVRNKGIEQSSGKYIAFCDDDDIWFPKKIELQVKAMKKTRCLMSSTDGLFGRGIYNENKKYEKYNAEKYYLIIQNIYKKQNSNLLENGFPDIWTLEFLSIHNCMVASSVLIDKDIIIKNKCIKNEPNGSGDDYRVWLKALKYTDSVYIRDVCFYYDSDHGDGQNH